LFSVGVTGTAGTKLAWSRSDIKTTQIAIESNPIGGEMVLILVLILVLVLNLLSLWLLNLTSS